MNIRQLTLAHALLASLWLQAAPSGEIEDPRTLASQAVNQQPSFMVRVDVDRADRLYHEGDSIRVAVRSERSGYLYLFYCDASLETTCLYPNRVQRDNHIQADETIVVPCEGAKFRLQVGAPFGRELLKAVVATRPLKSLELATITRGVFTPLDTDKLKRVFVEVLDGADTTAGSDPADDAAECLWAEHQVQLVTAARQTSAPPTGEATTPASPTPAAGDPQAATGANSVRPAERPKRYGVFIGVSSYLDPGIRPLRTADLDAQAMAAVMRDYGQLDDMAVLLNENATLENIRQVIQEALPNATRPGDEVFVYWSGHGGRTSNLDGTESDGYDEYLVPYDGRLEPADAIRSTMLLDKTFGRWVQQLDGRKLIVIIDACHSGGQSQGAVKSLTGGSVETPFRKFFFASAWRRTKDIGQRETAVLASSRAAQISLERRDGQLSVMTSFLVQQIGNSAGAVTLLDAAQYLNSAVPEFVQQNYPGTTQTPVFVDQTTPPVYLRP